MVFDLSDSNVSFAVFGTDSRQCHLYQLLAALGYPVAQYENDTAISQTDAFVCLFPIPLGKAVEIDFEKIPGCQKIFGGCIPDSFRNKASDRGILCHDYMTAESFLWNNAILTAESMIGEAILRSPDRISYADCLVVGYGHCGQALVSLLKAFSCRITVCDNSKVALAQALLHTADTITPELLPDCLPHVSYIFNTAPCLTFDRELLKLLPTDTLILDLASAPGGVDYDSAQYLGKQAFLLPGLPGKYAPRASARLMYQYIFENLQSTTNPSRCL